MEFLVDMSTHVPQGTSPEAVDDVRSREAVRAAELAAEGHLRRLWRPPVAPGQWRTLGLFAADDANELERALASMPLRIWRTDAVTPLAAHPDDPGNRSPALAAEFLATMTITTPADATVTEIAERTVREAVRAGELAQQEALRRLWTLPAAAGRQRILGLWCATDESALTSMFRLLPWYDWMDVTATTPLSPHPSDPLGVRAQ